MNLFATNLQYSDKQREKSTELDYSCWSGLMLNPSSSRAPHVPIPFPIPPSLRAPQSQVARRSRMPGCFSFAWLNLLKQKIAKNFPRLLCNPSFRTFTLLVSLTAALLIVPAVQFNDVFFYIPTNKANRVFHGSISCNIHVTPHTHRSPLSVSNACDPTPAIQQPNNTRFKPE